MLLQYGMDHLATLASMQAVGVRYDGKYNA